MERKFKEVGGARGKPTASQFNRSGAEITETSPMKQDYPCLAIEESAPLDTELSMSYSITLPPEFGTKNDIPITTINNRGMPPTPLGPTCEIVRPTHSPPATKPNQTSRIVL